MIIADLLRYAMNHILDIMTFNEKIILLDYITGKSADFTELDHHIQNYFQQYYIAGGKYKGIVIAQFNKPAGHEQYTILTNKSGNWVISVSAIASLAPAMFQKFQIRNNKIINKVIGFMINFKGSQIVFKTKQIEQSSRGRSNKGQRCDRGEGKKNIIRRINSLLDDRGGKEKYEMGSQHKSTISSIYGETDITQFFDGEQGKTRVKINTLQLCVESELILRHYDQIKHNSKRWFFSVVDSIINHIEKLKI